MSGSYVYADLTFIINFVMDFCILWATAKLSGIRIVYCRLIAGAFLGGFYAVGYLLPELTNWYSIPMKIIFSCLLIIFALWPRNWAEFKKSFLYFYGISFMAAGATIAASFFFSSNTGDVSFSYFWLLGGIFSVFIIGVYGSKYLKQKIIPSLLKFSVELKFEENHCIGEGFLDTGNGLRDPLTNRPVLVAEYNLLKNCLPEDFCHAFEVNADENEMLDALIRSSWASRLRLIPFTSIGKKNGILVGIRADEIVVGLGKDNIFHKNLVVGIYRDKLSSEGSYQLLIPSEIVQRV